MPFQRQSFALHWASLPLDVDWQNLRTSGVTRMQLDWRIASDELLRQLQDAGVREVAVRLWATDYDRESARRSTRDLVASKQRLGVKYVILGREPENGFDMRYGSRSWGGPEAFSEANNAHAMYTLLFPLGVKVVSAAFTYRAHYRDWNSAASPQGGLQPGVYVWTEETRMLCDEVDYNGFHWGGADGTAYDIGERMRVSLWEAQARHHKPLFIDEVAIDRGDPVFRMTTYLHLATLLMESDRTKPFGGSGERVEWLCPFISAGDPGNPPQWPPDQILRDPRCYALVREYMAGRNF